jgi:hypothetical protein
MIKQFSAAAALCALLPVTGVSGGVPDSSDGLNCADRKVISATLKCPIPRAPGVSEDVSTAATYLAGPGFKKMADCDPAELGPICTTLIMTRITCTWEDMKFGEQELSESLWHGQGYREGDIAVAEEGYDSGLLASGDRYLARWSEFQLPGKTIAIWNPIFGTGKLAGINGQAVIECPPAEGSSIETCTVRGCYSLPGTD